MHVLKDPIRPPCANRYLCKDCMWMSNPNDKRFKCTLCNKMHFKRRIDYATKNAKNSLEKCLEENRNLIFELFVSQIETSIQEILQI
jgi:hypothetical protein